MRYCLWGHRRGFEQLATIQQRWCERIAFWERAWGGVIKALER